MAFVLVQTRNAYGLLPLPIEGEYRKTILQTLTDGSKRINILHVTAEEFREEKPTAKVRTASEKARPRWKTVRNGFLETR